MILLSKNLEFEWDEGNVNKSWLKHSVSWQEAEQVFINDPIILRLDKRHSLNEKRYSCFGKSNSGRYLFVSFTVRGNKVRVISARPMSKLDKYLYEKIQKNS